MFLGTNVTSCVENFVYQRTRQTDRLNDPPTEVPSNKYITKTKTHNNMTNYLKMVGCLVGYYKL